MKYLKPLFILFTVAVLLICFVGCLSNKSGENLFKSNFLDNVDRIVFSPNNTSITITNKNQIYEIIDIISNVKLRESENPELEGGVSIEFYSGDEKVSITVLSKYILTENKTYSTSRDITAKLRKYYTD